MLIVKLTKYFYHFQKKVTTHYISKGNFIVNNLIAVANLMPYVHKYKTRVHLYNEAVL